LKKSNNIKNLPIGIQTFRKLIDGNYLYIKTNKGRIDAVIIDKDIYIFGFEFNGNKNKALNQIKEKNISKSIRVLVKQFIFLVLNLPTEMWENGLLRKERRQRSKVGCQVTEMIRLFGNWEKLDKLMNRHFL